MTNAEKYVKTLREMGAKVLQDIRNALIWVYSNTNAYRHAKTFPEARKKNLRNASCTSGPQWGLLLAGLCERDGIQWYGGKGKIVWLDKNAKKNAKKYFHIIKVGKTVKTCIKDGTLKPGDICTYEAMCHVNVYLGDGKRLDSGHANCNGNGEGAVFKCWIGPTPYQNYKISYILRLKETTYRVQIGAYYQQAGIDKAKKDMKEALDLDTFEEPSDIKGLTCVFCGSFEDPDYAHARLKLVQTVKGYENSFIKTLK